uniref:HNH domain-containing protein n=1 Tax=viral metagenome TaxID=1070528 RepID=A0A6C0AXQ2_9ZZZZ|tara:strand:- start:31 stop:573 length:543 start_codon:yes stop_codon:yes gene_type:complete
MKQIEISGKHHSDKIKKANDPNNPNIVAERDCMQCFPNFVFENHFQIQIINKLYLNLDSNNSEFEYKKNLLRELDKKIISYKSQDVNKNKYKDNNITQEQAIEKLVISKLKCYYCKCNMKLFYKKVRDMEQWTLDRIDNNLPHQEDNVIVSCLKCNLQRRQQNKDKFLFTKQLKIIKQEK